MKNQFFFINWSYNILNQFIKIIISIYCNLKNYNLLTPLIIIIYRLVLKKVLHPRKNHGKFYVFSFKYGFSDLNILNFFF